MPDLKDAISPSLVASLAAELCGAWPDFDRQRFERLALIGLADRELKARVTLIANALVAALPADPVHADLVIRAVLSEGGMQSWASLAVTEYVAATMLDRPEIGLPLLAALTPRFSAEFAIRRFIVAQPGVTLEHLYLWTGDADEHVRRLVSEGTRPRLPWAPLLRGFIADPTPALRLLDRLFDDESEYVRRSVANHLNDISKDHPDLAIEVATRWLRSSTHGDFVARHGLRTLVKRGHPEALGVLGFGTGDGIEVVRFACEPDTVALGGATTISCTFVSAGDTRAVIDYRVHYQGANGRKAPKVFKLTTCSLTANEPFTIRRTHIFDHVSIRRIHPGPHRIEIQVNGKVIAGGEIVVTDA